MIFTENFYQRYVILFRVWLWTILGLLFALAVAQAPVFSYLWPEVTFYLLGWMLITLSSGLRLSDSCSHSSVHGSY